MTDNFIGVDISGARELSATLQKVPAAAADAGVESANEYIVDVERLYPPRVQHGESNPYQWQSEKQRRYVMAKLRAENNLPYKRTQTLSKGWKTIGQGVNQIVVNEVPYAVYVKDVQRQRGHAADGWDTVQIDIQTRMARIVEKFNAGVQKAIKRLGL